MDIEVVGELASQEGGTSLSKKVKHNEEAMGKDGNCTSIAGSASGSLNSDNLNGSNSDMSYHDDDDGNNAVDDCEDVSDYDDNDDYMFDNDDVDDDDDYLKMQAQFDNVDLPPGVEAPVSWLKDPAPIANVPVAGAGTSAPSLPDIENCKNKSVAASTSTDQAEASSGGKKDEKEAEILRKFELFKRFDTVDNFSDHHYSRMNFSGSQPPKAWSKKIQDEWRILEKDLPDTIYVRVYESRMELLRAVIVGPAGTPYHDGLFVFDVFFPSDYPDVPPMVYYYSGGLRINPNLYDSGKVCLSLLNTWNGDGNEKWMPHKSTMLQVLVSIQALILNARPFFNEPGYESSYVGAEGERRSEEYNEQVFILSLQTMMYTLRRPPKHFEDLVHGHFYSRAHDILSACKAYMKGAQVGSVVNGRIEDAKIVEGGPSIKFTKAIDRIFDVLASNFSTYAAKDCAQVPRPSL